jgi:transcriptional regulator with XRE-family HTH domain
VSTISEQETVSLAEEFKRWRAAKKISVRGAAVLFGVSSTLYHYWEQGKRIPHPKRLKLIRATLKVSAAEMLRLCKDDNQEIK